MHCESKSFVTLLRYSFYCSGLELNLHIPEICLQFKSIAFYLFKR